jgi:hypothetical protein
MKENPPDLFNSLRRNTMAKRLSLRRKVIFAILIIASLAMTKWLDVYIAKIQLNTSQSYNHAYFKDEIDLSEVMVARSALEIIAEPLRLAFYITSIVLLILLTIDISKDIFVLKEMHKSFKDFLHDFKNDFTEFK